MTAPSEIVPVHRSVSGRVRLHVPAFHRRDELARPLEAALAACPGVISVRANAWTGNVLILHDGSAKTRDLIRRTRQASSATRGKRSSADPAPARAALAARRNPVLRKPASSRAGAQPDHVVDIEVVLDRLGADAYDGLTSKEAADRLARDGPNLIEVERGRSALSMLASQFASLPVGLLSVSAAISVATVGVADAAVILAVVAANAGIGFVTERQAERTIASLDDTGDRKCRIMRGGRQTEVTLEEIVAGDLILLAPGMIVPADSRLVRAELLSMDESSLTGESIAADKQVAALSAPDLPLADQSNMVFRGTSVASGGGAAVVTAVGAETEIGRIQALIGTVRQPQTPLQRQLDGMGRQLVWASLALCSSVAAVGMLRGLGALPTLKAALSLAIAAVPEGLPAIATTTMALGIRDMRRRNVLVRRLSAIETLGSVQVLCLDKTGTLTRNDMSLVSATSGDHDFEFRDGRYAYRPDGSSAQYDPGLQHLLRLAALCSEARVVRGDGIHLIDGSPTEAALLRAAEAVGIDVITLHGEEPALRVNLRTEGRQLMSTVHERTDGSGWPDGFFGPAAQRGYCIGAPRSSGGGNGLNACGAGGRYPSDECGLRVL